MKVKTLLDNKVSFLITFIHFRRISYFKSCMVLQLEKLLL